jgi:hypothetical protein
MSPRIQYDKELSKLNKDVLKMGMELESAIKKMKLALRTLDDGRRTN